MVTVTSDYLPSPHRMAPPLQSDVEEHTYTSIQLSYPRNITSLNFIANLVVKPMGCHMIVLPQPPSSCSANPLGCTILCPSILNYTPVVNEDKSIDGVGVPQPTYAIIYEEYD